ncbi:MAG: SRPBCC domain-containing protein [Thaumarchaeota archaeon]|nr:SRPBCC domain-containing protein [Nitrososphaerota archaeon]
MAEKQLIKTVNVAANPDEVWDAWTTVEGIRTFFAPDARLELRPGGLYEIYFDTEQPEGLKGSEGCRILSFVPSRMLSFTWGAPPRFPRARRANAQWVVIFLEPSGGGTSVTLIELGWEDGEESDAVYRYFDRAWATVLALLARSFSSGPVDWANP